jgi:AraC family transcriptional regulator, ethanolamine operon transcriptional activator
MALAEQRLAAQAAREAGPEASVLHFATTADIDDQAALLRGWNQTYTQLSSGHFAGSIAEIEGAGVQVFLEETSNALYQLGQLPRGKLAVGIPLKCLGPATFCGAPCGGPAIHVFSGGDGFEFHSPGGLLMAGVVVSEDLLSRTLCADEQEYVVPSIASAHLRRTSEAKALGLRQLFTGIFDVFRGQPELAQNIALLGVLRDGLVSNLAHVLTDERLTQESHVAPDRRWQIVASARDLVVEQPDTPITVGELCQALGVSRRTLQYCFQDVFGLGPAEFLRNVRLGGARRAIKSAQSVTEAATLWGFWHFSRFAHDYKAMFGELPSETFRRHHGPKRG